jgi:hypothetical protein
MNFMTAHNREEILANLRNAPISVGQIDLNGLCNAKCWFCPVKYKDNPEEFATQTTPDQLRQIFKNLRSSLLFPKNVGFLYTSHYNEVLLHKNFEEMMDIFREYGFTTMILSNGTPLTPAKIDYIVKNQDVITGINLNIPAIAKDEWAIKAGMNDSVHKVLVRNLQYLNDNYKGATVQVNSLVIQGRGGPNAVYTDAHDCARIEREFQTLFPNIKVNTNYYLSDRAGELVKQQVMIPMMSKATGKIIGCSHSTNPGGRIYSWVHINAKGELFLCCDDYDMKYRYGSLLEKPFDELWASEEHVDQILRSQNEICRTCSAAIRG